MVTHSVSDQDGRAVFNGVTLPMVLELAGMKFSKELQGEWLATYLVFEASDSSRVVFSLPEIDSDSTGRNVVLAYRRDGHALDEAEGPLRLVVSGDTRKTRWLKRVKKLTLVSVKSAG